MDAPVTLVVPADPRYVHIVRAVATAFAAHLALPFDAVEDLRLAIGECCNRLLGVAPEGARLELRLASDPSSLTARVGLDARASEWPPTEQIASLSWSIIQGLADRADETLVEGVPELVVAWQLLTEPA
jgi:hypothetical protein